MKTNILASQLRLEMTNELSELLKQKKALLDIEYKIKNIQHKFMTKTQSCPNSIFKLLLSSGN